MPSTGKTGGAFAVEFPGECVFREFPVGFPGILADQPGNFPVNFLGNRPSSREIHLSIHTGESPWGFANFTGRYAGNTLANSPGIHRETAADVKKVGAGVGGISARRAVIFRTIDPLAVG